MIIKLNINDFYMHINSLISRYMPTYEQGLYTVSRRYKLEFSKYLLYENNNIVDINNLLPQDIKDDSGQLIVTKDQILGGHVRNTPMYPVLPAKIMAYYVDIYQRDMSRDKNLYYGDELFLDNTQLISVDISTTPLEMLGLMLPYVPEDVLTDIDTAYTDIMERDVVPFFKKDDTALYVVDTTGYFTIISATNLYESRYRLMTKTLKTERITEEETHQTIVLRETKQKHDAIHTENLDTFIECISSMSSVVYVSQVNKFVIMYKDNRFFIKENIAYNKISLGKFMEYEGTRKLIEYINYMLISKGSYVKIDSSTVD